MLKKVSLFLFILFLELSFSQNNRIDSLKTIVIETGGDSNKVKALNTLAGELFKTGALNQALQFSNQALSLSIHLNYLRGQALALENNGTVNELQSNHNLALDNFKAARELYKLLKNKKREADVEQYMGGILNQLGEYPEALQHYFNSLRLREELKDSHGICLCLGNIGNIYAHQENHKKSLEYFVEAYKIAARGGGQPNEMSYSLQGIGKVYYALKQYDSSLKYTNMALQIQLRSGDKRMALYSYQALGNVNADLHNYKEAFKNYELCLSIAKEIGEVYGILGSYINMANLYSDQKQVDKAIDYERKAYDIASGMQFLEGIKAASEGLASLYDKSEDTKNAYFYYKKFISARDTLMSEENAAKTVAVQMQYDFDKKQALERAEQEKKDIVLKEAAHKKNMVLWFVGISLLSVIIFLIYLSNRFRLIKKQKNIIEEQKKLVEFQKEIVDEKQEQILSSIYYARRIQQSLMPTEKFIERKLNNLKGE
jgi:tetratricopeptide (TPR) repeat protein